MSLSQETPPDGIDPGLADYLSRRFQDVAIELTKPKKYPERKEMPYKPQSGQIEYFGDPATHSYDAEITEAGWWGLSEGNWILLSLSLPIEVGYLTDLTTPNDVLNNAVVNNWDNSGVSDADNSLMVVNAAAGSFTIGVTGTYRFDFNFIGIGGGNNIAHYMDAYLGGVFAAAMAVGLATQQVADMNLSGFGIASLTKDDVVTFRHRATGANAFTAAGAWVSGSLIGKP